MGKLFIARKFVYVEGGARHLYEEGIFDTYKLASEFIKSISLEEEDYFLSEIVSYNLNDCSSEQISDIFIFDKQGTIIWRNSTQKVKPSNDDFTGKYSIGDIVKLQPFPWNSASPTVVETIGVISRVPVFLDKWLIVGNDVDTWDNLYVVDYIRDGYLGHWHVRESGIDYYQGLIPDNLSFIKILSAHYLKLKVLPKDIINGVNNGAIFIEKVNGINFEVICGAVPDVRQPELIKTKNKDVKH